MSCGPISSSEPEILDFGLQLVCWNVTCFLVDSSIFSLLLLSFLSFFKSKVPPAVGDVDDGDNEKDSTDVHVVDSAVVRD